MKDILYFITGLVSHFIFYSCGSSKGQEIDAFITKYAHEDFSKFQGVSIFQRSAGINHIIYGIGLSSADKPLYFVEYNIIKQKVSTINNKLVRQAGLSDYLTNDQIEKYISDFRRYNFYLLRVDDSSNVFINPYSANSPALLMRMNHSTGNKIVRKGYVYELYKNNWYLNHTR